MNHKIIIERKTSSLDEFNQPQLSWVQVVPSFATIKPVAIPERRVLDGKGLESINRFSISIPFVATLLPLSSADALRIRLPAFPTERIFNVLSAINVNEENVTIMFDCAEGSVNGS